MAQKILSARSGDAASASGDMVVAAVDQVVFARGPRRVYAEAVAAGLKRTPVEVAVAYDGACVTSDPASYDAARATATEGLAHGVWAARAGVGFPAPVHLERLASPARLCVTDEPRLAAVGGIGMLALVVPSSSLAGALVHGTVLVRAPVSVQVLLGGRLRPFVCARDVALELVRRGLGDVVRRVEESRGAPVVLEFGGPSARLLSVGERAVLAALAPQVGAAAALFVSDERTEVFLRDQRRSKAHRALAPDAGAPCEEVVNVDLGAVDPLLLDENGQVRAPRDLAGQPVSQALLGGDGGVTLRDLFAAATLVKSKRVPPGLDFLLATPSRQMLEVLASAGALTDLIATGARLVEPDARVVSGAIYSPAGAAVSIRTCDPEPRIAGRRAAVVASAETLAYAVATGEIGDPRSFKRPVRVTVPRALPTDDVLITRKAGRGEAASSARASKRDAGAAAAAPTRPWEAAETLLLVEGAAWLGAAPDGHGARETSNGEAAMAVLCASLDEVRELAQRAADIAGHVRAVLAPYIPGALVALLSGSGIAAIRIDALAVKALRGQRTLVLPAPGQWPEGAAAAVASGGAKLSLTWLALGAERTWVTGVGVTGVGVTGSAATGLRTPSGHGPAQPGQAGPRAGHAR
jgi:aconitate hydratase